AGPGLAPRPSGPSGPVARPVREPFVHKQFQGVHFVANGYDYWFPKSDALPLTECAALTLLDYFNCKLGKTSFRAMCESAVIEADDADWIPGYLDGRRGASAVPEFDKANLFPEPEEPETLSAGCCWFHSADQIDTTRDPEVIELYADAQSFTKAHVMPAPLLMLGQDVVLDPDRFLVRGNQIHVLGTQPLAPINFAACQSSEPDYVLDVALTVDAAHFLVPPILFEETDTCYHLRFDFFRNTWMVKHRQTTVPIPMVEEEADWDTASWLSKVGPTLISDLEAEPDVWWARATPESRGLQEEITERAEEYDWEHEEGMDD
ncbi:hypothetical protein ACFQ07_32940, partial [Actinomadura adrarensis]